MNSALVASSFVFASVLLSSVVHAETDYGVADCGEWLENSTTKLTLNKIADMRWLGGYLSGLNTAYSASVPENSRDPLRELQSLPQALLWMDNYCKAHPLENIKSGALDLFIELVKRKKKSSE